MRPSTRRWPGHLPGPGVSAKAAHRGGHARVPRQRLVGGPEGREDRARPMRRCPIRTPPRCRPGRRRGSGSRLHRCHEDRRGSDGLGARLEANLDSARLPDRAGCRRGPRLVALPEYFCLMGRADSDKLAIAEHPGDGAIQRMLAEAAAARRGWLVGGTLPPLAARIRRVLNSTLRLRRPDGGARGALRQDPPVPLRARRRRPRELRRRARVLRPAPQPVAFDADGLRVGLSVCYDLRFPSCTAR